MECEVRKRDNRVVAAVIEIDARNGSKLFSDVMGQLQIVKIPLILVP